MKKAEVIKRIDAIERELKELRATLETEDKPTYRIGQMFVVGNEDVECILAQTMSKAVNFIVLEGGNRYADAIIVKDINKITSKELNSLCEYWELVR